MRLTYFTSFVDHLARSSMALDSTTIDLCLSLFQWSKFRKHKGAIKLHTLMDLRGSIPSFIMITNFRESTHIRLINLLV